MVNYRCTRCGYNTDHKSKFRLHLLKKNICPSKFNETSIYDILKLHGFDKEATEYEIIHNVVSNVTPDVIINTHICKYCKKSLRVFTKKI